MKTKLAIWTEEIPSVGSLLDGRSKVEFDAGYSFMLDVEYDYEYINDELLLTDIYLSDNGHDINVLDLSRSDYQKLKAACEAHITENAYELMLNTEPKRTSRYHYE